MYATRLYCFVEHIPADSVVNPLVGFGVSIGDSVDGAGVVVVVGGELSTHCTVRVTKLFKSPPIVMIKLSLPHIFQISEESS